MTAFPQTPQGSRPARVTRVVYGVYVVLVTAFVVSSTVQVARALYGSADEGLAGPTGQAPRQSVDGACAREIDARGQAIERARALASGESGAEAARVRYAAERKNARAEEPELARICSNDPHGTDALAALERFDRAAESHAVRTAAELSPVRLAAQSFIRGDLP